MESHSRTSHHAKQHNNTCNMYMHVRTQDLIQ